MPIRMLRRHPAKNSTGGKGLYTPRPASLVLTQLLSAEHKQLYAPDPEETNTSYEIGSVILSDRDPGHVAVLPARTAFRILSGRRRN